jgi:hypothetical protein
MWSGEEMVNRGDATGLTGPAAFFSVEAITYGLYPIFVHYGVREGVASMFVPLYGPYFELIPDKKKKRIFKHDFWWIWAVCVGFLQILPVLFLVVWLQGIHPPSRQLPCSSVSICSMFWEQAIVWVRATVNSSNGLKYAAS